MSDQPNTTGKLVVGGAAGAITTIIVWAVESFTVVKVPLEVGMALSTIITLVSAHLTPVGPPPTEYLGEYHESRLHNDEEGTL